MPDGGKFTEADFEQVIMTSLYTSGGYERRGRDTYNAELSLIPRNTLSYIESTQHDLWYSLVQAVKGEEAAERKLVGALCDKRKKDGTLSLLRTGFSIGTIHFSVIGWKPDSQKGESAWEKYGADIFTCLNQVEGDRKLRNPAVPDVVLFVNGIPIVTMELKYEPIGQDVTDAEAQYRARNTSEPLFSFKSGPLVHFAVDSSEVYMTTRLCGHDTEFLPFNQGSAGAGNAGREGNPPAPEGKFQTYYLWENVLPKDSLLDILQTYVTLDESDSEKPALYFPRYHQLDAVRKLVGDIWTQKVLQNYLVAHSAGSGKSNTIAWLAFHLANLYSPDTDKKIFNKIIILNDRRVLDKQTGDTLASLQYSRDVGMKHPRNRTQLLEALKGPDCIIISTLQKFPYIFSELQKLALPQTYAIIADEAHQSQGGETTKGIAKSLGTAKGAAGTENAAAILADEALEETACIDEDGDRDDNDEAQAETVEKLINEHAPNISYFGFTATPKAETIQLFGTRNPGSTEKTAFHTYSMCQAIHEGFILNVLQNYMTYRQYYKLKQIKVDTNGYEPASLARAASQMVNNDKERIKRIATIIVNHFLETGCRTIDGTGKAMVVTAGRWAAVEYCRSIREILRDRQCDYKVLAAFSGTVAYDTDVNGVPILKDEAAVNSEYGERITESQTRSAFHKAEYRFLVVADKYQTGFSEKLLSCMYIDKPLHDIRAVQTLSRLDRTVTGKTSDQVYVIDFANDRETIQKAFKDFYMGISIDGEITEDMLREQKQTLESFHFIDTKDVEDLIAWIRRRSSMTLVEWEPVRLTIVKRILKRYMDAPFTAKDAFRCAVSLYLRYFHFLDNLYGITQKDYVHLAVYVQQVKPLLESKELNSERFTGSIENYLRLEKYSLKVDKEFSPIEIDDAGDRVLKPSSHAGGTPKSEEQTLFELLENLNVLHGTDFKPSDTVPVIKVFLNSFAADADFRRKQIVEQPKLFEVKYDQKSRNVIHGTISKQKLDDTFSRRLQTDEAVFKDFQRQLKEPVYDKLRDELFPEAI